MFERKKTLFYYYLLYSCFLFDFFLFFSGGSGLVGKGIESHLSKHPHINDQFIYLTSKEGDLRFICLLLCSILFVYLLKFKQHPHINDQFIYVTSTEGFKVIFLAICYFVVSFYLFFMFNNIHVSMISLLFMF
jgi:hypothetical protein